MATAGIRRKPVAAVPYLSPARFSSGQRRAGSGRLDAGRRRQAHRSWLPCQPVRPALHRAALPARRSVPPSDPRQGWRKSHSHSTTPHCASFAVIQSIVKPSAASICPARSMPATLQPMTCCATAPLAAVGKLCDLGMRQCAAREPVTISAQAPFEPAVAAVETKDHANLKLTSPVMTRCIPRVVWIKSSPRSVTPRKCHRHLRHHR